MMMKIELTQHARNDRLDRLSAILTVMDLGEIVLETADNHEDGIAMLTSTGIVLIKSRSTGKLITGYMATPKQARGLYHSAGIERMPKEMKFRVEKNNEKYSFLYKV